MDWIKTLSLYPNNDEIIKRAASIFKILFVNSVGIKRFCFWI